MFRPLSTGKSAPSADNIYVNLSQYNDRSKPILQNFTRNYDYPILDKARHYTLTVIRFLIDASLFPIRIIETTQKTDVNEMKETITLEYNGEKHTEHLIWVTQEKEALAPIAASPQTPIPYYYLYDFQHYLNILNTALATAFNKFDNLPDGATPPYFRLNVNRKNFELVCDSQYYDEFQVDNPIHIYANDNLSNLLLGFSFVYGDITSEDYARFIIQDTGNNKEDTNLIITSISSVLQNFNGLKNLYITSNLLPCQPELLNTSGVFNQQASQGRGNQNQQVSVLASFIIPDELVSEPRRYLFLPEGQDRKISMLSDQPIKSIDIGVYGSTKWDDIFPLELRPECKSEIKLMFERI